MIMIIPSTVFYALLVNIFSGVVGRACSTDDDCNQFNGLDSWNEEFVSSLCTDDLSTDKSMSATLCDAYADNSDYEISMKLAIVNTMYGTGPISSECGQNCMYDPLHVAGEDAIGFKWYETGRCWNVHVGSTNSLCYQKSVREWEWAVLKANNFCCSSDPTDGSMCSMEEDCYEFVGLDSFDEEEVLWPLCDAYQGNGEYENAWKLAIVNNFGSFSVTGSDYLFCHYDPVSIGRDDSITFEASFSFGDSWDDGCYTVVVGNTGSDCLLVVSRQDLVRKAENWCCHFNPTPAPTACNVNVEWSQERADELCPGYAHHAYGVGLCDRYDNPDYQRRLEVALANELYSSCSHSCLYDYEIQGIAFFWKGSCYNVQIHKWSCIDNELSSYQLASERAAALCETDSCQERIVWTPEADENNCPDGYSGKDKGYGTAKVCSKPVRMYNGYYEKADDLYQASFNLSLANHAFWSCSAKCIYDIENAGVVYQWKGEGCWEMQTKWACITTHAQEYNWASKYIDKLCPIATPAPSASSCTEFVYVWDADTALRTCGTDDMGLTDKSADAAMCSGFEDYQLRLEYALANRAFLMCDAWCVYDIIKPGNLAYIWRNDDQCYKPATKGICIWGNPSHRSQMQNYIRETICYGCQPYLSWSELTANDWCPSTFTPDKSYGIEVCDGTSANQKKLDDSLANVFFTHCGAWCVYDYETLVNNVKTGSSDYGGFLWQDSDSCWKWVTSGTCFTDAIDEYNAIYLRAERVCIA